MDKVIDLSKSIYELSKDYPDIVDIMKELGFDQIAAPGMLSTVGRFMTILKGAASRGISMETIKEAFENKGFRFKES